MTGCQTLIRASATSRTDFPTVNAGLTGARRNGEVLGRAVSQHGRQAHRLDVPPLYVMDMAAGPMRVRVDALSACMTERLGALQGHEAVSRVGGFSGHP